MAAMVAIIVWGTVAWYFGIPTSQSHSLIAGLTGGHRSAGQLRRHQRRGVDQGGVRHSFVHAAGLLSGWLNSKALDASAATWIARRLRASSVGLRWPRARAWRSCTARRTARNSEHLRAGHHVGHGRGAGRSNDPAHLASFFCALNMGLGTPSAASAS
ncbi:MAG: inorganic phosphate transporter [Eggerthella lenta]